MTDEEFMRGAIRKAQEGIAAGQSPFGAVIVHEGRVIAEAHNTVWRDVDPTAHAEVNCIREAARALKFVKLFGCTLYSTCEPCPMCLAASHWSKIERVVYGAEIADAASVGFSELPIPAQDMIRLGQSSLRIDSGVLKDECAELFPEWKRAGLSPPY